MNTSHLKQTDYCALDIFRKVVFVVVVVFSWGVARYTVDVNLQTFVMI